jgi:hypothetical protein
MILLIHLIRLLKPTTIPFALFVDIAKHWLIRQLDVKKKFTFNNPVLMMPIILPLFDDIRALAADFQPFFLYLGNKTTFYFPIKKYLTIDSLIFPYIN